MATNPGEQSPAPKRILCVEDESAVREIVALHLRRRNYLVETAADGLAAWQLLARDLQRFDVIVTDNHMPRLGGVDLVAKLRDAGYGGKIVFFSSTLPEESIERVARLRVDAIVEKGLPVEELLAALARVTRT